MGLLNFVKKFGEVNFKIFFNCVLFILFLSFLFS